MSGNKPFHQFPKVRKPLPSNYKDIYDEHYVNNRNGKTIAASLSQKMEGWLHRCVAKSSTENKITLEIGAGTLNQLQYEKTKIYDIVEPYELLYKDSPALGRVRNCYTDISEITPQTPSEGYDRITAVACFEHVCNLPEVVERCGGLLREDGVLCVSIPNEGRFLWKLGYTMTTGLEFKKKYGLDYDVMMRFEHVNNADEIEEVLKYYFKTVKLKLFGINKTLALYRYYECNGVREH